MAAALLQLSYHRFPWLSTHRAQELEIIKLSLDGLKKRFPSALGAERVVNQMLKHKPDSLMQDVSQSSTTTARMSLTEEQKEFFVPFGPELCRKWASVFDDDADAAAGKHEQQLQVVSRTTTMLTGGLSGFAIDTRNAAVENKNHNRIVNTNANATEQANDHRHQDRVPLEPTVTEEMDTLWNPVGDGDGNGNGTDPFFSADDSQFLLNEQDLDSVGRWWWADWVPEADLDFLSKSL